MYNIQLNLDFIFILYKIIIFMEVLLLFYSNFRKFKLEVIKNHNKYLQFYNSFNH